MVEADLVYHLGVAHLQIFPQEPHTEHATDRNVGGANRQPQLRGDDDGDCRGDGDAIGAAHIQFGDLRPDGANELGAIESQADGDAKSAYQHDPKRNRCFRGDPAGGNRVVDRGQGPNGVRNIVGSMSKTE